MLGENLDCATGLVAPEADAILRKLSLSEHSQFVAESYMERDTLVTGTGIYEDESSELSNPRCDKQTYEPWSLASNF